MQDMKMRDKIVSHFHVLHFSRPSRLPVQVRTIVIACKQVDCLYEKDKKI